MRNPRTHDQWDQPWDSQHHNAFMDHVSSLSTEDCQPPYGVKGEQESSEDVTMTRMDKLGDNIMTRFRAYGNNNVGGISNHPCWRASTLTQFDIINEPDVAPLGSEARLFQ
jgi:hypothetical protein